MKRGWMLLLLTVSLFLTGCGVLNGSYVSVTPHQEQRQSVQTSMVSASNYLELMDVLENMVASGTESATINVAKYPEEAVPSGMSVAMRHVMENDAIGAYAVDDIEYSVGFSGGQPAVAVKISYLHSRAEIRQIQVIDHMDRSDRIVAGALENLDTGVVMLVENYTSKDFYQFVDNYARENPQLVMEVPQVIANVYGTGSQRVVELKFVYQTPRDSLRQMQQQVDPVFDAAVLYVSGDGADWQKYSQLYGFLMERFDYTQETSITPAYSLLRHGVGDNRAFATVYAAMCRAAGLECMVVTGTRSGEPWTWNIVKDADQYYHVDLLWCSEQGSYIQRTDLQMQRYVWDYSAYPACVATQPEQEQEQEQAPEPQETEPVEVPEENFEIFEK